jgi:hypothetical protein
MRSILEMLEGRVTTTESRNAFIFSEFNTHFVWPSASLGASNMKTLGGGRAGNGVEGSDERNVAANEVLVPPPYSLAWLQMSTLARSQSLQWGAEASLLVLPYSLELPSDFQLHDTGVLLLPPLLGLQASSMTSSSNECLL